MSNEILNECVICKKNGIASKCSACIINFKKMEMVLKRKAELEKGLETLKN